MSTGHCVWATPSNTSKQPTITSCMMLPLPVDGPKGHWIRSSPYSRPVPELEGMETSSYIHSLFNCFTCGSNRDVACNKWRVNGLLCGIATEYGVTATRRFNNGKMIIRFTAKSVSADLILRRNANKTCLRILITNQLRLHTQTHTQT